MSTQELQMILNTLQGLGAEGKSAFIWWMVLDKVVPVIGWLLTFCGLLWAGMKIISVVSANSHIAKLRDEMGIGSPGPLWGSEAREVLNEVRKLMGKKIAG